MQVHLSKEQQREFDNEYSQAMKAMSLAFGYIGVDNESALKLVSSARDHTYVASTLAIPRSKDWYIATGLHSQATGMWVALKLILAPGAETMKEIARSPYMPPASADRVS